MPPREGNAGFIRLGLTSGAGRLGSGGGKYAVWWGLRAVGVGAVDEEAEGNSQRGAAGEEDRLDPPEEEEDEETSDEEDVRDAVPDGESTGRRFNNTIRLKMLTGGPRLAVVELTGCRDRCPHNGADLAQQLPCLSSIFVVPQHLYEDYLREMMCVRRREENGRTWTRTST